MKLTREQVSALRSVPLGSMPNKVGLALTMTGTTQTEVSDAIDLPRPNISKIVNGRYEGLQLETSRKLAEYFGCAIEDLFPAREEVAS
jgi:DNA-binding XRE family transcriptional regulator